VLAYTTTSLGENTSLSQETKPIPFLTYRKNTKCPTPVINRKPKLELFLQCRKAKISIAQIAMQ
jgi:hypothetical protein